LEREVQRYATDEQTPNGNLGTKEYREKETEVKSENSCCERSMGEK
jgi:hypothetical protein